uniref:Phage protein n=1 Tax=Panagrellus redivivus TaxID=6233 RepID=A0A7E4VXV6_PANRE
MSIRSYNLVIPLISGKYNRLVIYGDFTWAQVKRLIHGNVKQIRIMSNVKVNQSEDDDVVNFVLSFSRGIDYK